MPMFCCTLLLTYSLFLLSLFLAPLSLSLLLILALFLLILPLSFSLFLFTIYLFLSFLLSFNSSSYSYSFSTLPVILTHFPLCLFLFSVCLLFLLPSSVSLSLSLVCQVLCWGVREMKRFQLLQVTSPLVELECGSHVARTKKHITNTKVNPNFPEPVVIMDCVSCFCKLGEKATCCLKFIWYL